MDSPIGFIHLSFTGTPSAERGGSQGRKRVKKIWSISNNHINVQCLEEDDLHKCRHDASFGLEERVISLRLSSTATCQVYHNIEASTVYIYNDYRIVTMYTSTMITELLQILQYNDYFCGHVCNLILN